MATGRRQQSTAGDVFQRNIGRGAALGAGAFVVGYVLTWVFAAIDGVDYGSGFPAWKGNGMLFFGSHNVETDVTLSGGSSSGSFSFDIFSTPSNVTSTIPEILYLLLPVAVLVGFGYVAYQQASERQLDGGKAAALGATVVAGYLPLALLGSFLFEYSASGFGGSVTLGPDLATSVILAGIVYPVLFGALGAVLAQQTGSGTGGRSRV